MKTSYFKMSMKDSNAVSIAARPPKEFKGREYKKLAPKYWFFKKYKKDGDEKFYKEQYYKEVLNKLNPEEVYHELGKDAILLCWEKPVDFCHRHIVAEWLNKNLKLEFEITEIAEDKALDSLIAYTLHKPLTEEEIEKDVEEFLKKPIELSPEDKKAINNIKFTSLFDKK